jgi:GTP-binding protein HflX
MMTQRDVLAGAGGVLLGAARTDHAGRRAVLLVRGDEDTSEFVDLAATMGIVIVEVVKQRGREDPRTYLGRGRLDEVADLLRSAPDGHAWRGVDLVLFHANATPRQLVAMSTVLDVEVWDRVRLLLALFTAHAASVEARTQVRIARLRSDRTVLREVISQETTGERAGYGGAGATGATEVLVALGREIEGLRRRLQRHARAQSERRRQRTRSGARTVGLAGYTNAGKSSLFRALSGKSVLVEDRLFSTLETTVGRMEASPRVLLADTIGFIDALPSETLEAFRATLAEALECDLLLLMADASDDGDELLRRLSTSIREVQDRLEDDDVDVMVVMTKADLIDKAQEKQVTDLVAEVGLHDLHFVSAHTGEGMTSLRDAILTRLHGPARVVRIEPPADGERPIAALEDAVRKAGLVLERRDVGKAVELLLWCDGADIERLMAHEPNRLTVVGEGVDAFRP